MLLLIFAYLALAQNVSYYIPIPSVFDNGSYPNPTGDYFRNTFTRNCHSHNDYWRDVPSLSALSYGFISQEADVWLYNQTLFIGHDRASLRPNRLFSDLYVNTLVQILDAKNPVNDFTSGFPSVPNGVFDTSTGQTIYLFVDVKTDGETTWPFVVQELQPLREKGYLSYWNGSAVTVGPVTVVGTGNTPLDQLLNLTYRDYFFDGPLAQLNSTFNSSLSPIASVDYASVCNWTGVANITSAQTANLTNLISQAHSKKILTRFWDTPAAPVFARQNINMQLLQLGSDIINCDDLDYCASL